jgi:hypothetical protein
MNKKIKKKTFDKVVNLLHDLFEQADQDTPSEYRSRHFRDTMTDVEEMLIKLGERIKND